MNGHIIQEIIQALNEIHKELEYDAIELRFVHCPVVSETSNYPDISVPRALAISVFKGITNCTIYYTFEMLEQAKYDVFKDFITRAKIKFSINGEEVNHATKGRSGKVEP